MYDGALNTTNIKRGGSQCGPSSAFNGVDLAEYWNMIGRHRCVSRERRSNS